MSDYFYSMQVIAMRAATAAPLITKTHTVRALDGLMDEENT
jgi:hypothetical protein